MGYVSRNRKRGGDEPKNVESPFNPRSDHAGGLRVKVHPARTDQMGSTWQPKHEVGRPRFGPLFRDTTYELKRTHGLDRDGIINSFISMTAVYCYYNFEACHGYDIEHFHLCGESCSPDFSSYMSSKAGSWKVIVHYFSQISSDRLIRIHKINFNFRFQFLKAYI